MNLYFKLLSKVTGHSIFEVAFAWAAYQAINPGPYCKLELMIEFAICCLAHRPQRHQKILAMIDSIEVASVNYKKLGQEFGRVNIEIQYLSDTIKPITLNTDE